jgi:hypothetical protein
MTIRRPLTATAVGFLLALYLLASAPGALAQRPPEPSDNVDPNSIVWPPAAPVVVHDGTSLWVFALVAAVAACVTAAAILAVQSYRAHRANRAAQIRTA